MDDRVRPIDVTTVQERVYQELRNALYQGRFMPGEVLTIRALAAALGTSPMPVREAIQRLVTENALTQLPNRTFQVAALTLENYDEWIRVRCEVEGYAAQRAALRARPGICTELRKINRIFGQAIEARDAGGMLEGNQHFHFAVYEAADSDALLKIIGSLWLRFGPVLAFVQHIEGSIEMFRRGVAVHERVIAAMERHDAKEARFALALDIRAAASWFRRHHFGAGEELQPEPLQRRGLGQARPR
ncbi:GntR family transcriptional regulator [Dongia sedimenti]|uniref:GntR family transcriptional regulator n=1 Tax=Dongia sedimenti TaxID=3064282 RepID=A0ABU0YP38_9PROT|nr:GntR family transcriptional regulator [Rhodospirillaceae bacterium R-7]